MNKWIFSWILICATMWSAHGQLVLSFSSDTVATSGETVDVDVVIESGFDDIISFQFSLNWDPGVFTFSSIQNVTDTLVDFTEGSIGTPPTGEDIDDGELTLSWNQANTEPVSLPNGTRLFTLRLFGQGDLCESTAITVSNTPRITEVINGDLELVDITTSGGELAIYTDTCLTIGGSAVMLSVPDIASEANSICMPVRASNFDDIGTIQLGMAWDPSIVRFTEFRDVELEGVMGNTGSADMGELRLTWIFDQTGVTLPDGSTLFEVCYDIIGNQGERSNIDIVSFDGFDIDVANIDEVSLDVEVDGGSLTVGSVVEEGTGLIFPHTYTNNESSICVPITTRDFMDVSAVQTGITYDPSVLTFTEANEQALTGITVGEPDPGSGELRFVWADVTGSNAVTVADGDTLFELCFDVVGDEGDVSELDFTGDLAFLEIEILDPDGAAYDFFVRNGSVTVGVEPAPDFTLAAGQITGTTGDTVCMPITVAGFTNIEGLGYAHRWDAQLLRLIGHQNYNISNTLGPEHFANDSDESLFVLWTPSAAQTVDDGTVIYELCYEILGNCDQGIVASVDFTDANTPLEIVGPTGPVDAAIEHGAVTIGACDGPSVNVLSLNGPSCTGDVNGSVNVDFVNTTGEVSCVWTDENGSEVSTNCNLGGVGAGAYALTAMDGVGNVIADTFVIADPEVLEIGQVMVVTCPSEGLSDGVVQVPVSGGVGQLTYTVGVGMVDNTDGTISGIPDEPLGIVVADENGCELMIPATNYFNTSACGRTSDPTICDGGSIVSPNNDGRNDQFLIQCPSELDGLPNFLTIYDRWGNLVFEGANYNNDWTGTDLDGQILPEGGYMWVLVTGAGANRSITRGTVSILR